MNQFRLLPGSVLLLIFLVGCGAGPAAKSSCLTRLTDTYHQQDLAISPSGNRAAVYRSQEGRESELLVFDTTSGRLLVSREPSYNLRWFDDERLMIGVVSRTPTIQEWNVTTGITRTIATCNCSFDIAPSGRVARVFLGAERRLEVGESSDAAPSWTFPMNLPGRPRFSPDGKYVAVRDGWNVVIIDALTGKLASVGDDFSPPGNHSPTWVSNSSVLVGERGGTNLLLLDAATGRTSKYVTIPLDGEPSDKMQLVEVDSSADGQRLLVQTLVGYIYHVDVACVRKENP